MKTTVDIPESLFRQLRDRAGRENTTMKSLIHAALRSFLSTSRRGRTGFTLKDGSVGGQGLAPGLEEGEWRQIRELAYEGRGG
jgi:hypothetical protein